MDKASIMSAMRLWVIIETLGYLFIGPKMTVDRTSYNFH